ncbi:MAG TPA: hypothetical protein VF315_00905, partial [Steroidobacteraceae bacterium]
QAQETRAAAEQARAQAEQLLSYLTDDFSRELASFGRLDVVAELAKRQVDYFEALPAGLKGRETTRNGAMAMVQYAKAMRGMGNLNEAGRASAEAVQLLGKLRQGGDTSSSTIIALALGTTVQGIVLDSEQSPQALPTQQRAAGLLKPLAEVPNASLAARRAYVEVLERLGFEQLNIAKFEDAYATLRLAMRTAEGAGARDLSNPDMAAEYASCGAWQVSALTSLGRFDEARRVGADAGAVADRLIEVRPSYLMALRGQQLIASMLASLATDDMQDADAIAVGKRAVNSSVRLTRLDPGNTIATANWAADLKGLADANWQTGRRQESLTYARSALEAFRTLQHPGPSLTLNAMNAWAVFAVRLADVQDAEGARGMLAQLTRSLESLRRDEPAGSALVDFGDCLLRFGESGVALRGGDATTAQRVGRECLDRMAAVATHGPADEFWRNAAIFYIGDNVGNAEYMLGDYARVERTLGEALIARAGWPTHTNFDRREQAEVSTLLAMALARNGDPAAAQRVIAPVVKLQRELAARNHDDQWQRAELAAALYAQALADKMQRSALLREAASVVASLPVAMRELRSVRLWRDRISAALHPTAAVSPTGAAGDGAG